MRASLSLLRASARTLSCNRQTITAAPHARRAATRIMAPAAAGAPQSHLSVEPSRYPQVRRDASVVETLHGEAVADPYRWLEDPDSEETQKFVEGQNELTSAVLAECDTRGQFKQLFTDLYNYPKYGTPFKKGSRYYYYFNSGLQQQFVLYTQAALDAEPSVLLDPNALSEDGTVALRDAAFSDDGRLLAYQLSSGGSDWARIKVLRIGEDGSPEELGDTLEYVKFSCLAWTHDNLGFFYNRYREPEKAADLGTETESATDQQLVYHVLGTPQSEDVVIWAMPDHPTWMSSAEVSDDGAHLLLYVSEGCQPKNRLFHLDLSAIPRSAAGALNFSRFDFFKGAEKLPVTKLVDNFEASYDYVANEGSLFYFKTNLDAPRYRVVRATLPAPGPPRAWADAVPQHGRDLLQSAAALAGDNLVLRYLRDVRGALALHRLSDGGLVREVELPGIGSIGGFSGSRKGTEFFYSFQSFVEPGATYRGDAADASAPPALFRATRLSIPHEPSDYEVEQIFATSRDGTKVPMFVTHRRGMKLDGANPTLLYGYGGFNISLEPTFSPSRLTWLKAYGGVYVQANLRGGGEYGVEWRDSGSKQHKQNVFDDFQACAEELISRGYCSPASLAIMGGSNGGLLVAACINQRPDLYCCGLAQVGVMDMLRFHKFTIGHAWTTDYGDPDKAEDFAYIRPYSPLHNVAAPAGGGGQYPALLLATGDHDDRVVPLHSHKLISELQHTLAAADPAASAQRNPLLIRVEVRAGHGAGKPTAKIIEETADLMAFAAKCMGAAWRAG
ncbi:MAG: prolyl oligopeptidase [Monoraphidium minutum]|nr:MAG: prolyl oligopeptidase [Monoraphidium minutum]